MLVEFAQLAKAQDNSDYWAQKVSMAGVEILKNEFLQHSVESEGGERVLRVPTSAEGAMYLAEEHLKKRQ